MSGRGSSPGTVHDRRVLFMCESCEEHNPEGAVGPRSDIAIMPDGTWLCGGCYSDCDKSAYGKVASDVDDFEFPRFEDLPRPAPYAAPQPAGVAQQPGWQPIETAPKDGMYLMANDRGQVCPCQSRDGFQIMQNMVGFADWEYGSTATGWQPLPAPPSNQGASK